MHVQRNVVNNTLKCLHVHSIPAPTVTELCPLLVCKVNSTLLGLKNPKYKLN